VYLSGVQRGNAADSGRHLDDTPTVPGAARTCRGPTAQWTP